MISLVDLILYEKQSTQADWREKGLDLHTPKSEGGFFDGNLYHFTTYGGLKLMLKTGKISFTPGAVLNQYDVLGNSQNPRDLIAHYKGKWNSEIEHNYNTYYISTTTNSSFWGGFPGLEHIRPRRLKSGNPFYKEGSQDSSYRNDSNYLDYLKRGNWEQTGNQSPILSPDSWRLVRLVFDTKALERDFILQWTDFHVRANFDQEVRIHPRLTKDGRPTSYNISLQDYVLHTDILVTLDSKKTFERILGDENLPQNCIIKKEGNWIDYYNPDDEALQGKSDSTEKSGKVNFSWRNEDIPLVLKNSERNSLVEGIAATLFCLGSLHKDFDFKSHLSEVEKILTYRCKNSKDLTTIKKIVQDINRWLTKMKGGQFNVENPKSEWEVFPVEYTFERIRTSLISGGKSFIHRKLKDTSTNAAGLIHKRTHNSLLADNALRCIDYLEDLVKQYGYSSFTALVKAWISQPKNLSESFNLRTYLQDNWLLRES